MPRNARCTTNADDVAATATSVADFGTFADLEAAEPVAAAPEPDKRGKPKKVVDPQAYELLKSIVREQRELSDEDIINFMMIPLCMETVRCLEDGIVETAAEADMGLIYGIGFPPFRGGALRYIDSIGVAEFVALADKYADLGALYHPTAKLREMAANGQKFFG